MGSQPLGDGNLSTAEPAVGYIYACREGGGGPGAQVAGEWISDGFWDSTSKISVQGSVSWADYAPVEISQAADVRTIELPLNPNVAASPTCLDGGPIGYLLDGVALFNGLDAQNLDAVAHEIQDACGGHPEREGTYHYHNVGPCALAETEGSRSTLVGYALDGFGIYVTRDTDGNLPTNADLDECHGRVSEVEFNGEVQGVYHYEATLEYPYTVGCYRGTPAR